MRALALATLLSTAAPAFASPPGASLPAPTVTMAPPGVGSPPALVDRDAVRGQLEALAQQLVWVQRAAERNLPASPELLTRMQREVAELQRQVLTAPAPMALPPPPPPRHEMGDGDGDGERGPGWGVRPMRPDAFGALIGAVRNEHFDENRLRIAGEAAARNWFAVDQVLQLIETCSFSEGKLHMLELAAPHLVDRRNDFQILQAFRFDDDKAKAQEILARTPSRR